MRFFSQKMAKERAAVSFSLTKTQVQNIFKKRLPGVGSEPGASGFHLFSHFHHFTAEPQRLPQVQNITSGANPKTSKFTSTTPAL
jgi:hypothetical protein